MHQLLLLLAWGLLLELLIFLSMCVQTTLQWPKSPSGEVVDAGS